MSRGVLGVFGLLLLLGLLLAAPAAATYEQVATFGEDQFHGEQANSPMGIAVNTSGAGGVPPGTVYAVTRDDFYRYSPQGEFLGALPKVSSPLGVAVDQATGNVYVRTYKHGLEHKVVQIFSADGTPIGGFGEEGAYGETIDESPEKLHDNYRPGGIAVDDSGTAYVADESNNQETRVMVFEPQTPGDYEHYLYTGRANDVNPGGDSRQLALDAAGNLYTGGEESGIFEFALGQPGTPVCEYRGASGVEGMTVDPKSGEVFYYTYIDTKIHGLGTCNSEGEFEAMSQLTLVPKPVHGEEVRGLALNPELAYEAARPAGILYAAAESRGHIFAPAQIEAPSVESESVMAVGSSSATLGAQIDPHGSQTSYAFQYVAEAAYEENEPNERQALRVSASGGVFGLRFEGSGYGGEARATLTSGSATANSLRTAAGTASLKAGVGTATLKAGAGKGTVIAGSATITSVTTSEGTFETGQQIAGTGIPAGTTITAVKAGELTISKAATKSEANASLHAGFTTLTSLTTSEGAFEAGQLIEGEGIPANTTILKAKAGELTLSNAAAKAGSGVAIHAGFTTLTALSTSEGAFETGQLIEGIGIAAGTTILTAKAGALSVSKPPTKPGTGVAIASAGPGPFSPGQRIEGTGIPAGTTIAAAKAGELTLSNPATASGTGVTLHAGLPFDATATEVREALESLPSIGAGDVAVSGGPGDEAGSSPYLIEFTGDLANTDVPLLEADGSGLSGGSSSATVESENEGGHGFDSGTSEAPLGGSALGSGQEALSAGVTLSGLTPDTTYRYRAIATSHCNPEDEEEACEDTGPTQAFRTFGAEAPGLADNRAWELVSPAQKHGGEVFPADPNLATCPEEECKPGRSGLDNYAMQSSTDGEAVVYQGFPFSPTEGAALMNEYISRRNEATGWQTTTLSRTLQGCCTDEGYKAFDAELSQGVFYQGDIPLAPEAPAEYPNLYTQPTADPAALTPLLTAPPPNRSAGNTFDSLRLRYAGASADFSRLFFAANDALTGETPFAPEAVDGGLYKENLYEWAGGQLRLVNVLPGNAETVPGAEFGSGRQLKSGNSNIISADFSHAISIDGSRVFWSSEGGQVYVREGGESTREIPDAGRFLSASADGSELLLNDGHIYDLETEETTDLAQGKGGFEGIAGQSEDLSAIYFVDAAALTGEEENERGAVAQEGKDNLYAWQEGTTSFLATLDSGDNDFYCPNCAGDWQASPAARTAEASPDGRWLAFLSQARLTSYDNTGPCIFNAGKYVNGPCSEVFLYDSATGELVCPSCNPTGVAPLGLSTLRLLALRRGYMPQPRYLSEEGRLYFDSRDSLSPFDTNDGVEDVYQYEPQGVGSCQREAGCVSLISAGHEPVDSNFLAMDETGKNVFFTTRDQLVLKDRDELIDLYDAREGGGIASETETARTECQGEACQPTVSPPNHLTPASSSLPGDGNVVEKPAARCSKGKVRRKGRCVRRRHGRAAKHKRGGSR